VSMFCLMYSHENHGLRGSPAGTAWATRKAMG
jgi:hypothetical protein